ncbi:hypothetical protein H5410_036671, partial [Solanum commersonii]
PSSSEQTSSSRRHSDIFDSFQSLKLKSSPQPKGLTAMSCLQGYYGLKLIAQKAASERFEIAVYSKGGSYYLEDGPFYKSSPLSNPPLSLQIKSKSVANGFMSENGVPANHLSTQDTRNNGSDRWLTLINQSFRGVVIGEPPILTSNSRIVGFKPRGLKRRSRSMDKLKALKTKIKDWSKSVQEKEIVSRMTLLNDFEDIARKEEIAWQQRSRATWLKEGDRNTNFFHKTVNAHRRTNTIDRLKVGERWRIALGSITIDNFSNLIEEKDSLVWQSDIHGKFSANSAYRALNKNADQETDWQWRMIWKLKSKQRQSTIFFYTVSGLSSYGEGSIKGVLSIWIRDGNASTEERWKFVPACVCWTIWKERNNKSFENVQNSLQKIKMNCLALLYFWCKQDILAKTEDIFDANSQKSHSYTCKNIITCNSYIDLVERDLPNSPGTGKNHHEDKAPIGKTQAKLGEDSVLPTPISQNPLFMPNVLVGMDKEGNTKASKIKGIDSMLPLPLTPLDNCLTVVEVVGVLGGGLEGNITNLQEGVSKEGFLHHENLHTDPKKDPRDSATTSHQTT